jgi:asparagine synthetase B (glutamine-hydrolysing)
VAGLVTRRYGASVISCYTAAYALKRYSELELAALNAVRLGLKTEAVSIGARRYYEVFHKLSRETSDVPAQSAPVIWYCLAERAHQAGAPTILTGDHAESFFLGLPHYFAGLPTSVADYVFATDRLSREEQLQRIHPRRRASGEEERLVEVLGLDTKAYRDWLDTTWEAGASFWQPYIGHMKFHTLQELRAHVWRGIPWQHNWLPVERALNDVHFISPFFDIGMLKFGLSLPIENKIRDGQVKFIIHDLLRDWFGIEAPKRYSPNPLRWWTLMRSPWQGAALPPPAVFG